MPITVVTLTFQGEPVVAGDVQTDELKQIRRETFPRSPRRDASSDPGYHAVKFAPLESGRLLVSVVQNRGENDVHGRPALRATACVLDREALSGPLRDVAGAATALAAWKQESGVDGFLADAARSSAWENEVEAEKVRAALAQRQDFHVAVAGALRRPKVDVWVANPATDVMEILRPALLFTPAWRLMELEFASGSTDSDSREAMLCQTGRPDHRGPLGNLLGHRDPVIDCTDWTVKPANPGPTELAAALAGSAWPGVSIRDRLRLLVGWMDSRKLGSPFDAVPEFAAMRGAVKRLESVERAMWGWR